MVGFNRDDVIRILTESEYTSLRFTKVDGTERWMLATLNKDQLALLARVPEFEAAGYYKNDDAEAPNWDPNQIRVFDLEKKGWRSFRLSNLIHIEGRNT